MSGDESKVLYCFLMFLMFSLMFYVFIVCQILKVISDLLIWYSSRDATASKKLYFEYFIAGYFLALKKKDPVQ